MNESEEVCKKALSMCSIMGVSMHFGPILKMWSPKISVRKMNQVAVILFAANSDANINTAGYIFTTPSGNIYIVKNISNFCCATKNVRRRFYISTVFPLNMTIS